MNYLPDWYLQLTIGNQKTPHYLGPDNEEVRERVAKERALWAHAVPDIELRKRLVAMLASGGAYTVTGAEARILELLERVGVFLVGDQLRDGMKRLPKTLAERLLDEIGV